MNCLYSLPFIFLLIGIVKSQQCTGDFTLPQFYFDGMVFQSTPNNPEIWGFTNDPSCTVEVTQTCNNFKGENHFEAKIIKQNDPSIWSATITGYDINVRCTLNITQGDKSQTLDIIFGDVYICSGQSNMERRMDQIYNSTEEIAASASNSYLWNAMIHPLLRHTVYGGLWYQGIELNALQVPEC